MPRSANARFDRFAGLFVIFALAWKIGLADDQLALLELPPIDGEASSRPAVKWRGPLPALRSFVEFLRDVLQ